MPTPSAEGAALVRTILEHPADDTARQVYADWLQETGEPGDEEGAEFIRRQIAGEIAMMPLAAVGLVEPLLGAQRHQSHRWAGAGAARVAVAGGPHVEWRRGFVEQVQCATADWLTHGAAVLGQHPVTWVVLSGFTVAITPPGADHGWQLRYYEPGTGFRRDLGPYFAMASWLGARDEMIEQLMSDVRDLEAEFA